MLGETMSTTANVGGPKGPSEENQGAASDRSVAYYVTGENGNVIRAGRCNPEMVDAQVINMGESVHLGEAPVSETTDEVVVTHTVARKPEYPSIGDQLDVLWKLLTAKPELLTSEALAMAEQIAAVKKTYPKEMVFVPNNTQDGPAYVAHAFRDEFNPS
jgi:hypothetical protein